MMMMAIAVVFTAGVSVLSGCRGSDGASTAKSETTLEDQAPKYASPWDKPLFLKNQPAIATTYPGPPPKTKTLTELLQGADSDAPMAPENKVAASDWVPGTTPDGSPPGLGVQRSDGKDAQARLNTVAKSDWSIVIAGFNRETEGDAAATALDKVRNQGNLTDAYLEERGKAIVVAYGKYDSANSPAAKRDIDRIRGIEINKGYPFAGALLAPPLYEALAGTNPEFDLRNAKARFGKDALYTLQVGIYTRADGAEPTGKELGELRAAAEKAVNELRRQGDQAFYYHGPRRSMVTVGIFTNKDYDAADATRQSPQLVLLRQKYPYNLENGAGVKRKRAGQTEAKIDQSFVVALP